MAGQERFIRDTILAGVSLRGDDAGLLAFAEALAERTGAPLKLVHVHAFQPLIAVPPPDWEEESRARALDEVEALAAPLRERVGVTVEVRASPSPVRALHEAAEDHGASVLVAGAHRRHALPGGVGERLLHAAPCAIAVVPGEYPVRPWGLRRIGVAFAAGPEGEEALALAAGLARDCDGHVRTFTVTAEKPRGPEEAAHVEEVLSTVRATVPADLLEGADVLVGDAAEELVAASAGLDVLVCGSRGYGPVRSLVLGGVSRTLVRAAGCPVLVVPRGAGGAGFREPGA